MHGNTLMDWIQQIGNIGEWPDVAISAVALSIAVVLGLLGYGVLFKVLFRLVARSDSSLNLSLVQRWRHPAKLLLPLLAVLLILPSLQFPGKLAELLQHMAGLALIASVAWLLSATIYGLQELVLQRYDVTASDNLKARAVSTQVNVLIKIVMVLIIIIAGATMLMTFDKVHEPAGLGRDCRDHYRFRCPAQPGDAHCRHPDCHHSTDKARRRGNCRRGMGAH